MKEKHIGVQLIDALMVLTDHSNWPDMQGPEFLGYMEAMEALEQVITDFQSEIYAVAKESNG